MRAVCAVRLHKRGTFIHSNAGRLQTLCVWEELQPVATKDTLPNSTECCVSAPRESICDASSGFVESFNSKRVCATLSPFPFCHLDLFAPEGHQWGRMAPWQRCAATRQGQRSRESAAEWWNREVKQKGELKGIFLRNPFWRQKQKKREETFLYLSRNDINAHTKKERERHLMFCRLTSLQQQKQNKKKPIEQIEKEKNPQAFK